MADTKLAGALAIGLALGAGGTATLTKEYETTAQAKSIRLLPDDKVAVKFETTIGDCTSEREIVFYPDGHATLNGRETDEGTVKTYAAAVEAFKSAAKSIDPRVADKAIGARFLSDGQMAVLLEKNSLRAELVVDAEAKNPRLSGIPIAEEATSKAMTEALAAMRAASESVDTDTLVKPIPRPSPTPHVEYVPEVVTPPPGVRPQ